MSRKKYRPDAQYPETVFEEAEPDRRALELFYKVGAIGQIVKTVNQGLITPAEAIKDIEHYLVTPNSLLTAEVKETRYTPAEILTLVEKWVALGAEPTFAEVARLVEGGGETLRTLKKEGRLVLYQHRKGSGVWYLKPAPPAPLAEPTANPDPAPEAKSTDFPYQESF